MSSNVGSEYLRNAITLFRRYKNQADKAVDQVDDDEFFFTLDDETNSIAVIVKHMAGNMRSRWTDFLTSDGEKPDRNRENEFVADPENSREALTEYWEAGWHCLFAAIEPLTPDDLLRTATIRGEAHTVVEAINRQLTHYAEHVGQIIFLAKHLRSSDWKSLSIPRGESDDFNSAMKKRHGA